jgi:CRP-like cAMP-binding protein
MSTTEQQDQLPGPVAEFLQNHNTLTLATASSAGIPRAATFLYVSEGPSLYFWTRTSTVVGRNIEQNPLVSFTIDEYTTDLSQTRGIQGSGECRPLLSGEQIARVADLFGQKFPSLSPGATMSIAFFRITPTELQFIDNTSSRGLSQAGQFGADFNRETSYSMLGVLPPQASETVSATLGRVNVGPDEVIARAGGPADKFFIVVDGEVEVRRGSADAPETVTTVGPGELFGEMSVLVDKPRAATVRAVKPTTLLTLDGEAFRELIGQSLGTTSAFDQVLRQRLEQLRGPA